MKTDRRFLLLLVLVIVGGLLLAAVPVWAIENHGRGKSVGQARKALEQELLSLSGAGFVGIAHSDAEGEVIVFVEDEQAKQRVPRSFEGYVVRTEVTGKMQALYAEVAEPLAGVSPLRRDDVRPLVGGTSLSADIPSVYYAGTLGMITYDNKILSNAHVIAMDPTTAAFLDMGTPIWQPGSADGGESDDQVGTLQAYIPIDFDPGAENYADAAIGSIDSGVDGSYGEQFGEGGNYWIEGWANVSAGDIVRKSGRTTGVTTGEVIYTNASVAVNYEEQSAYFVDQIVVEQNDWSFGKSGDSGAAVDKDGEFVGLLFAGSEDRAVICKAEHIIDGLGIAVEPVAGQYSLTIASGLGGSVSAPGEGRFIYDSEEVIGLLAVPDEHYHFVEWTGDVSTVADVHAASTTVTMNGNYRITANFELDPGWYSLTISSAEGGSVTDPGETQPGEAPYVYAANTTVPLVAEPDQHYHFDIWTGDVSTIDDIYASSANITMYDSYSITANFEVDEGWYSLTISSTDGGSVTEPGQGIFIRAAGSNVSLVAVSDEGCQFVKWTGDASTIADIYAASTVITMNASYSITANFETPHPDPTTQLTVSSTTGGAVTVPGEGTFTYPLGAEVSLVAEAVSGYRFVNWSGDVGTVVGVSDALTIITMDSSYAITANFGKSSSLCFIATAAYGTPMAEEIAILREFRDEYLFTNPMGRMLVDLYYRVSPPVAEFITEHPNLKPVVRVGLAPAVAMSDMAVNSAPSEKAAMIGSLALVAVVASILAQRRQGKDPQYTEGGTAH